MSDAKPVVLLIFDGWGTSERTEGNAILSANTPTWDNLLKEYPHSQIDASGETVGLPAQQMGNSEVGHLTMGAGRTLYQDLTRINKAIEDGAFFENPVLNQTLSDAQAASKAVHVLCLLSPGGVHSHETHLFALLELASRYPNARLYIHAFLDGRDTPPKSAQASLERLAHTLKEHNATLASVSGRFYAMDRDKRYERLALAFDAIVHGKGPIATTGLEALTQAYAKDETDEFVTPCCIRGSNNAPITLQDNDSVIFLNFRSDRARQLSHALTDADFPFFDRGTLPQLKHFVTLTEYDSTLNATVALPNKAPPNVLGEYLSHLGKTQLHLAETEKYAHVTFFFNGGREAPFDGEVRHLVPSPKVTTYDHAPQMSAVEITTFLVDALKNKSYDFIVCNFANADMVGHTGNFDATVKAIETLDRCLAQFIPALIEVKGQALITSDHGNAECMFDPSTKGPHTAHTTSLIPAVYVGDKPYRFRQGGNLSDIAPTVLLMMGLTLPPEMTGISLLEKEHA